MRKVLILAAVTATLGAYTAMNATPAFAKGGGHGGGGHGGGHGGHSGGHHGGHSSHHGHSGGWHHGHSTGHHRVYRGGGYGYGGYWSNWIPGFGNSYGGYGYPGYGYGYSNYGYGNYYYPNSGYYNTGYSCPNGQCLVGSQVSGNAAWSNSLPQNPFPQTTVVSQETPQTAASVPAALGPNQLKIRNPGDSRGTLTYVLNGMTYTIQPGQAQVLDATQKWVVAFNRGPSLDNAVYTLSPGMTYSFAMSTQGWELYGKQ